MIEAKDIAVYPRTEMVLETKTGAEVAYEDAFWLYNQMVCDRRYEPEDILLLLLLGMQYRMGDARIRQFLRNAEGIVAGELARA